MTTPKPFVFVLMPFSADFDDVYQLGIKAACTEAGAYCERVDEQIFNESILERVYNQINKADLIVADMTSKNPNVFYEVGYAHALGKTVILLTKTSDDIPFDLKHYPHIVYSGKITVLKDELERRVAWFISQMDAERIPSRDVSALAEFYICDEQVRDGATINLPYVDQTTLRLLLTTHNLTAHDMRSEMEIGLVFPQDSGIALSGPNTFHSNFDKFKVVRLPNGDSLYMLGATALPGPFSWLSAQYIARLRTERGPELNDNQVQLQLFHASGVYTISFALAY